MPQTLSCQSCSQDFVVDSGDSDFYDKIQVPKPTFCPQCRLIRRLVWRNEHFLFKKQDENTKSLVFSAYPPKSPIKIFEHDYWWSDAWDPSSYGKEYDFSKAFFEQFYELMVSVPWPSRSVKSSINSDYCNNIANVKDAYLCFSVINGDNLNYGFCSSGSSDCVDFNQTKDSRLCYETFLVGDSERMFWSSDCAHCYNVWFSSRCRNCSDCFGCVGLQDKQYCIFNQQYTKDEYERKIKEIYNGSRDNVLDIINRAQSLQIQSPSMYMHGRRNKKVSGDYIYACNNTLDSFELHNVDDGRFSQFVRHSQDVYDFTSWGLNSSLIYESVNCGDNTQNIKFSFECWPNSYNLEYCIDCHSSSDCFGCVGLKKKQYCIFNKQYSKEEYFELRSRIIEHMVSNPYISEDGHTYSYGEFFPPQFSPFKYEESSAQDYFKNTSTANTPGEQSAYQIEVGFSDIPNTIGDTPEDLVGKVIGCKDSKSCEHRCVGAFKITRAEFDFYKRFNIPVPNLCPNCRFYKRMDKLNSMNMWERECMCTRSAHPHGEMKCKTSFKTNYSPDNPQVVYCEECYKKEIY